MVTDAGKLAIDTTAVSDTIFRLVKSKSNCESFPLFETHTIAFDDGHSVVIVAMFPEYVEQHGGFKILNGLQSRQSKSAVFHVDRRYLIGQLRYQVNGPIGRENTTRYFTKY